MHQWTYSGARILHRFSLLDHWNEAEYTMTTVNALSFCQCFFSILSLRDAHTSVVQGKFFTVQNFNMPVNTYAGEVLWYSWMRQCGLEDRSPTVKVQEQIPVKHWYLSVNLQDVAPNSTVI